MTRPFLDWSCAIVQEAGWASHSIIDAHSYDSLEWHTGFLIGTKFADRTWRPVLRGDPNTGDIIAPIRALAYKKTPTLTVELTPIADAVSKIRDYFMPRRAKQRF